MNYLVVTDNSLPDSVILREKTSWSKCYPLFVNKLRSLKNIHETRYLVVCWKQFNDVNVRLICFHTKPLHVQVDAPQFKFFSSLPYHEIIRHCWVIFCSPMAKEYHIFFYIQCVWHITRYIYWNCKCKLQCRLA